MKKGNPYIRARMRIFSALCCCISLPLLIAGCGTSHGNTPGGGQQTPPTVIITASPTTINAGASATLTVTATGATQVTIAGSDGSSYQLQASGGTQAVTPKVTTSYTATATGPGGTASAKTTIQIASTGAPTVTLTANPASIAAGASSTLTVTATNAAQVTITGSDGSTYQIPATGGTQKVSPTATTTYTATATGASGGTITAQTTVTVTTPPNTPTVTIAANPTTVVLGNSSTLTVTATNASQVTIAGSDGTSYNLTASGGTATVTPKSNTTYTATATNGSASATANVAVTVTTPPAPAVTITASPSSISSGSSSTLTVIANNATQVTITGSDGENYPIAGNGGQQSVSPTATTTYTATATGPGGTASGQTTVTVVPASNPTVTITANPATVTGGDASTLTVTATNATQVTISGTDGTSYTLAKTGGTQSVTPASTTTYTATATGTGTSATAQTTVTVTLPGGIQDIDHVVFMLQENHSFDNYFGMLNPYRKAEGWNVGDDGKEYDIDGLANTSGQPYTKAIIPNQNDEGTSYTPFKLSSTCVDDESSAWLESFGDVNRYDFATTRPIQMNGFVHTAEGFAKNCNATNSCSGTFSDTAGRRSMGYYDQDFLNYYYYMASQFALSDRWFSPVASKSVANRIATFTGGTTQGLVRDPGNDDHLSQLNVPTIFEELDQNNVSWKIYYTVTQGDCPADYNKECKSGGASNYPATWFSELSYSIRYVYQNPTGAACTGTTQASSVVGDPSNSFCIDTNHIAPLTQYYTDLKNNTLPSFAFIESGSGLDDEHPGSGQSVLTGQAEVAAVVNAFMTSPAWKDSVFFLAYDEGGGPFDHVPPVPGHSNDFTDPSLGTPPDISGIAVNPDSYKPCYSGSSTPTQHCDLAATDPGTKSTDAPAVQGFGAQLGFRIPNMVISPFVRKHYVSHIPMDHTAVIKFVEDRFIGPKASLTARDAAQPDLLDFFDFSGQPWATPPTPPAPVTPSTLGYDPCTPDSMGP